MASLAAVTAYQYHVGLSSPPGLYPLPRDSGFGTWSPVGHAAEGTGQFGGQRNPIPVPAILSVSLRYISSNLGESQSCVLTSILCPTGTHFCFWDPNYTLDSQIFPQRSRRLHPLFFHVFWSRRSSDQVMSTDPIFLHLQSAGKPI